MRLLRDRRAEFGRAGVRVFGVSRDSHWSHRAWKDVLDVDVPLLSDWNGALAKRFGATRTWRWMEGVPQRSAFLVGEDGTVRGSWRYADSEVPDFDELLEAVRASPG
ncbi:MAG: redoxin domain-containing protein [Gaiellaceae bacterium]